MIIMIIMMIIIIIIIIIWHLYAPRAHIHSHTHTVHMCLADMRFYLVLLIFHGDSKTALDRAVVRHFRANLSCRCAECYIVCGILYCARTI